MSLKVDGKKVDGAEISQTIFTAPQNDTKKIIEDDLNVKDMNIYEKLARIQSEMNVPKNLFNSFGNYHYRNAETILDTAKPICLKYRTTLKVQDYIEEINGRYYVKAIANLIDWENEDTISNQAFAREEESKKGMDGSQVTGSASSYARKYALNGLFNLDDVKDADTDESKNQELNKGQQKESLATEKQIKMIIDFSSKNPKFVDFMKEKCGDKNVNELTSKEASFLISAIMKKGEQNANNQ